MLPGYKRRRDRHVVVAVLQSAHLLEQHADLIVAVNVALALRHPVGVGEGVGGELGHRGAGRRRKIRRGADQHHRVDAARLLRGHVEQRLRAHAQADRLHARQAEAIEQREEVVRRLAEREHARRVRRAPMPAQVGDDDAEAGRIAGGEHQLPVGADPGAAMEQEQRLAGAAILVVQPKTVEVDDHGASDRRRP